MEEFVELDRKFSPYSEEDKNQTDVDRLYGSSRGHSWDEILKNRRLAVLSEPGTGKTEELKAQTDKLRSAGKSAFFCRIELLQDKELENCFDIGTKKEFENWLAGREEGYFFLDSVDEALLVDQRAYEFALKNFADSIEQKNFNRITVVVSCRIAIWQANAYQKKFIDIVPPPETFYIKEGDKKNDTIEKIRADKQFIAYTLLPLDIDQIQTFANSMQVSNPEKFSDEVLRKDAIIFAERPQDLIDLIVYWDKNGRLGKHEEMLRLNIENKLEEKSPSRKSLAKKRLKAGVELLAASSTFEKTRKFLLPDRSIQQSLHKTSINPRNILNEWDDEAIHSLLDRPLFDKAIYGTVGFHHRSAREYLTAKWLNGLLETGKPLRSIEALIFSNLYGEEVILPSMAPIAAWLALWQPRVCEMLINTSPETLIENGDPASLTIDSRKRLLTYFAEKFSDVNDTRVSFDLTMMNRLADENLSGTISHLLALHNNNHDISALLLKIAWQGKLEGVVETAFEITIDQNVDPYIRRLALKVVCSSGSEAIRKSIAEKLLHEVVYDSDSYLLSEILDQFYPSIISTSRLLSILEEIEPPRRFHVSAIHQALSSIGNSNQLAEQDILDIVKGLSQLLVKQPYINKRWGKVSKRHAWLLQFFVDLTKNFFAKKSKFLLSSEVFDMILGVCAIKHDLSVYLHDDKDVLEVIKQWKEFNYQFFWYAVEKERSSGGKTLISFYEVSFRIGQLWHPSVQYLDWLLVDLEERESNDDRLVALSALFAVYLQEERPKNLREKIRRLVKGNQILTERRNLLFNPPAMSEEEKKRRARDKAWEKRREKQTKRDEEQRDLWIDELRRKPKKVLNIGVPEQGELIWNAIYLHEEMKKARENSHNYLAYDNLECINKLFNDQVAQNYRLACQRYWRGYDPFSFENWRASNEIPWARIISLTGLALEAKYEEDWLENLSAKEAGHAAKISILELNGFPPWFSDLQRKFPHEVERVIKEELKWEFLVDPKKKFHSRVLSSLKYLDQDIVDLYKPFVLELICSRRELNHRVLNDALELLINSDTSPSTLLRLVKVAKERYVDEDLTSTEMSWLITLFCLDADTGLLKLKRKVNSFKNIDDKNQYVVNFCGLLGGRRDYFFKSKYQDYESSHILRELVPLICKYIRVEDDHRRRSGVVYSPDRRDDAESMRGTLIQALSNVPGRETYDALIKVSKIYNSDYMLSLAKRRAELDAEKPPWTDDDIESFRASGTRSPKNEAELFLLARNRILDLKDNYEKGNRSKASTLRKIEDETIVRNFLANELEGNAIGQYVVASEDELADGTRPDITLSYPIVANPVPIELKLADNNWTLAGLKERMKNQVMGQYMKQSNYAIFLLVYRGAKNYWINTGENKRINFYGLIDDLQVYGNLLINKYPYVNGLKVIGIDLTLNIPKEKGSKKHGKK